MFAMCFPQTSENMFTPITLRPLRGDVNPPKWQPSILSLSSSSSWVTDCSSTSAHLPYPQKSPGVTIHKKILSSLVFLDKKGKSRSHVPPESPQAAINWRVLPTDLAAGTWGAIPCSPVLCWKDKTFKTNLFTKDLLAIKNSYPQKMNYVQSKTILVQQLVYPNLLVKYQEELRCTLEPCASCINRQPKRRPGSLGFLIPKHPETNSKSIIVGVCTSYVVWNIFNLLLQLARIFIWP